MATNRKTPGAPSITPGVPQGSAARLKLGIAARDAARKAGVDPKSMSLDDLIAWHAKQQQGGSAPKPQQPAPQQKPAGGQAGGQGGKPAPDEKPAEKPATGRKPSAKENQRIYTFLITNGMDKKAVDKMSPQDRKARYDQMLEDAKSGEGDAGRKAQNDVLEDPPEEPIKVKGGNAAQAAAADKIAPPQKKGGGRRGGGAAKPQRAAAKGDGKPKNVRPQQIDQDAVELDDPDLEDGQPSGDKTDKTNDKGKAGLSGLFGGAGRAKDWQSWASDPRQGMPEDMGYFKTPGTMRAVHALTRRPLVAAAAGLGAYKLLGKPLYDMIYGAGQEQQPQTATDAPPEGADPNEYWNKHQQYLDKQRGSDPVSEPAWWEKGVPYQMGPTKPAGPSLPADGNSTSTDIIRRLRGTV